MALVEILLHWLHVTWPVYISTRNKKKKQTKNNYSGGGGTSNDGDAGAALNVHISLFRRKSASGRWETWQEVMSSPGQFYIHKACYLNCYIWLHLQAVMWYKPLFMLSSIMSRLDCMQII
jgi:hypothetical protein